MNRIIFLSVFSIISCCAFAINHISVYRNDSTFNQIRLTENISLTHEDSEEEMKLKFSDWVFGETSVSLSAVDSCVMHTADIPVLRFTFPGYPEASALWDKENYIDALLDIEGNGYCDDAEQLSLSVKGRGNSTWNMPKKPMRLKFAKKTSIAGFKKAKSYVLLNNYIDPTLMRNAVTMWLARRLGVPYANTMVPCHVFINDQYAGAYTLTEKVGINSGSVDIDDATGMLFEISTEYDEKYRFRSKRWDLPVMVKDPDFDELYEKDLEAF
ncbi:MAG: CotH kinase family protein, partial [Muribaculaceae bacterium]|nr:CotH kinase family protein [Muribaculaceae bacterium]